MRNAISIAATPAAATPDDRVTPATGALHRPAGGAWPDGTPGRARSWPPGILLVAGAAALLAAGCGTAHPATGRPDPARHSPARTIPAFTAHTAPSPRPAPAPRPGLGPEGQPLTAATRFTTAYWTYSWRDERHLPLLARIAGYLTPAYTGLLQSLSQSLPSQIRAARETSAATVTSARLAPDAPGTRTLCNVDVTYSRIVTTPAGTTRLISGWAVTLTRTGTGGWLVGDVEQAG